MSPILAPQLLYTSLSIITIASIILYIIKRRKHPKLPGPPGFPIIGNLHQLGDLPHRSLHQLSTLHGPLLHLNLGQIPTIIISSPSLAKEILKTHDLNFCTRPALTAWQKLSYGGLDIAFGAYTDHWRQLRKLTIVEFFNNKRVSQSLQRARELELESMLGDVASASARGKAMNLSELLLRLVTNVTCMATFGKRFSKSCEFDELISETIELMGGFVAGDFFPSMQYVMNLVFGVQRRVEKNFREMDEFLERELKLKEGETAENCDDFASVLVRMQQDNEGFITRNHIKAVLMDIFIAGSDTAAQTLIWTMTELIRNPRVLTKAQNELRQAIKGKPKVEETDLQHLAYLNSVIKEVFRLHPPGPLLLPRECREACDIGGYSIPTKTRVYINAWAIGRDPKTWDSPDEFRPERFEDSSVDYKGLNFELLPFGGGRRICPGIAMASKLLELTLANLLYRFNWALVDGARGEDVDMSESFGIVVSKRIPLVLLATPIITDN